MTRPIDEDGNQAAGDSDYREKPADDADPDLAHLEDVADGCGCAEIWEVTSEHRADTESE